MTHELRNRVLPTAFLLLTSAFSGMKAQSTESGQQAKALAFETVSVRPVQLKDGDRDSFRYSPTGLVASNNTLFLLIQYAFGAFFPELIMNAPDWVNKESFDIEAKVSDSDLESFSHLSPKERNRMLMAVLVERFHLKYHLESKQLPVFLLTVAPKGPKLIQSQPNASGELPHALLSKGGREIEAKGIQIKETLFLFNNFTRRTVIDKTGLTGRYDFSLHWTPEDPRPALPGSAANPPSDPSSDDSVGPSIFTAVREQLGLELKPDKAPFDALFIEHIERPTPN